MSLHILNDSNFIFPHPYTADKDGFLAIGGDLLPARLLSAYQFGIFPWYNDNTPILWFSTYPRLILKPSKLKVSKSMRLLISKGTFTVTIDKSFSEVISACSTQPRHGQDGTWITKQMVEAYIKLHELGYAHSVEVWRDSKLVGGLYGLALGKMFYGESMFTLESNASKYGFISLVKLLEKKNFTCIDCQQDTPHLRSFGAELIDQEAFMNQLKRNFFEEGHIHKWTEWVDQVD